MNTLTYFIFFRSSFVLERRKLDPNFTLNGKSKSLDDLLQNWENAKKAKNISLLEVGRANTYDDQVWNKLGPFKKQTEERVLKNINIFYNSKT